MAFMSATYINDIFQLQAISIECSHNICCLSNCSKAFFCYVFQVESEFILESERESFIEHVREVIVMADEKGQGMKEGFPQVCLSCTSWYKLQ